MGAKPNGTENGAVHKGQKRVTDAGMRSLDHYATRLPRWRYNLRKRLIPIVRLETPYLAVLQENMRSPLLDSYFAMTANLGTHTFFMAGLPMMFWCGYTGWGRAMVHMLANGVFFSGMIKDMLCLPRPLSPPLQRITMSGSAALEYGFPSTHSTNAVSVAAYVLYYLQQIDVQDRTILHTLAQIGACWYAVSIVLGRLYCGMHGFFDVVVGSMLGVAIAAVEIVWGEWFQNWMLSTSFMNPLTLILIVLLLVRIHPEPADNCPCYDDSVAFMGTVIGVDVGLWHFAWTDYSWNTPVPATTPYDLESIGYLKTVMRIVFGVFLVFAWRALMKPTLLRGLPPLFRIIESLGFDLPRKFFLKASEYSEVPKVPKDDNVIPPAFDIPSLLGAKLQNPLRRRAVSIGPQSEADAWEALALRQQRRKESLSRSTAVTASAVPQSSSTSSSSSTTATQHRDAPSIKEPPQSPSRSNAPSHISIPKINFESLNSTKPSGQQSLSRPADLPTPLSSRVQSYEKMMGSTGPEAFPDFFAPPLTPPAHITPSGHALSTPNGTMLNIGVRADPLHEAGGFLISDDVKGAMRMLGEGDAGGVGEVARGKLVAAVEEKRERAREREIFERVQRPRVRYDVEVVTKLIVYTGIGYISVNVSPILFELLGLGMGVGR